MLTVKQWLEIVNYRVTEGGEYNPMLYSQHAYSLTSWNGVSGVGSHSLDIVFDTETQEVFEATIHDGANNRAYRIVNPAYLDRKQSEIAWGDVKYIELDVVEDFVEKATAIVAGKDYDTRVMMEFDLDQDLELEMYRNAHRLDITVNEYIERALNELIKKEAPHLTEATDD
jgi:hypothetical protein